MFIKAPVCIIEQFKCVKDLQDSEIEELVSCNLPTCIAMEIEEISIIETEIPNTKGILIVDVLNKPNLRYVRRLIETKLDIVGNILIRYNYK